MELSGAHAIDEEAASVYAVKEGANVLAKVEGEESGKVRAFEDGAANLYVAE